MTTKYTITHSITGDIQPAVLVPVDRIANLIEILDHCDLFLRSSGRGVAGELADYCLARPNLTSGWLIDMIGFSGLQLRTDLEEAGLPKPSRPQPARLRGQW